MKHFKILFGLLVFTLISCEKDIDIELPEASRKLVVEGSIEPDQPPFVILTKTEGYFDAVDLNSLQNSFIRNAIVTVSNGTNSVQLTEICTDQIDTAFLPSISELIGISLESLKSFGFCLYSTFDPSFFGEVGKTYTLNISADGEDLSATTTIPTPVIMEEYWYKDQPGFTNFGYLWFSLNDPPAPENAYRIYTQRKGKDSRFIPADGSVFDDGFFNGLTFDAFIIKLKVKTLQFHCSYFSFYKCFKFVEWENIERIHIQ